MSFRVFEAMNAQRKKEFMSHVSDEVRARLERSDRITWEEYESMRANSYERKLLQGKLTDEALIKLLDYCYMQSSFRRLHKYGLPKDYNEAVTGELLPMLLERLKNKEQ